MKGLREFSGISEVQSKEYEGKRIYYVYVGYEDHGKPTAKVFVHEDCLTKDRDVRLVGSRLKRTEKGNYVIVPDPDYFIAVVGWECGFRGKSSCELLTPVEERITYWVYRSERGSLGMSKYALVSVKKDQTVKAKLSRTGRTYGHPKSALQVIKVDGDEVKADFLPEEAQEDQELMEMLGG